MTENPDLEAKFTLRDLSAGPPHTVLLGKTLTRADGKMRPFSVLAQVSDEELFTRLQREAEVGDELLFTLIPTEAPSKFTTEVVAFRKSAITAGERASERSPERVARFRQIPGKYAAQGVTTAELGAERATDKAREELDATQPAH